MDGWQPERQRHKRTFTEMSHSVTLSPSPARFGDSGASNFFAPSRIPPPPSNDSDNLPPLLARRRTSHPHNNSLQRASTDMAEASQSRRPALEHRTSQTITIDLTQDVEEELIPSRNNQDRIRAPRPPRLGRSDAVGPGDLIDLTVDGAEDVIFAGERPRQQPLPRPNVAGPTPSARDESPPRFVLNRPQHANVDDLFAGPRGIGFIAGAANAIGGVAVRNFIGQTLADHLHFFHHDHIQAMPGAMNYQHAAFAERKPDHVAPPAVPQGFTRSPIDSDTVICPSCEEELVHEKDADEPVVKKGGKAPSRKDREEHPFWVVKECGHVYCNKCYQLRQQSAKHVTVNFAEVTKASNKKSSKILTCAVEDCESDVKSKEKWLGVFL